MDQIPLILLGAGSQAKVAFDLCFDMEHFEPVGCIDLGAEGTLVGGDVHGLPILGTIDQLAEIREEHELQYAALAIGDNQMRADAFASAEALGMDFANLIHPFAVLSNFAEFDELQAATFSAQCFVGIDARIGKGVILNTACSVDHDCQIGDFVHIAVGARLAGNVSVGAFTTIGAGATVIPGVSIGSRVTIGAGAVVTKDIPDGVTALGVPAKVRK